MAEKVVEMGKEKANEALKQAKATGEDALEYTKEQAAKAKKAVKDL